MEIMATSWNLGLLLCPVLWLFLSTFPVTPVPLTCRRHINRSTIISCPPCVCYRSGDNHVVARCRGSHEPLPDLLRSLPLDTNILCLHGYELDHLAPYAFSSAGLTSLLELDLSKGNLSSVPPHAFANLKVLEALDLSENHLSKVDGGVFVGLNELLYLNLSRNNISVLEDREFANNSKLQVLDLSNNSIANLEVDFLGGLQNLVDLSLSTNNISVLQNGTFETLGNLQFLDLSNNSLNALSPEAFVGLENLVNLSLSTNNISVLQNGTFETLGNLQFLDLSNNSLNALSPEAFVGLENLVGLSLQYNKLPLKSEAYPDGVFTPLNNSLRLLLLNGNSDVNCSSQMEYPENALKQLAALETLHIDGLCNATFGPGFGNLSRLRNLSLSGRTGHCAIGTLQDDAFCHVRGLTHLNLSLCEIRDSGEEVFTRLDSLEVLDLSCNYHFGFRNLSKAGKGLAGKNKLHKLRIDFIHNRYSVSIYVMKNHTEFFRNTSLQHLYASGNRIESFERGALSHLPKTLQKIVAKYNRFTFGPYILELPRLTNLTYVDVGNGGIDTDLPDMENPTDTSRYCLPGLSLAFPGSFHPQDKDDKDEVSTDSDAVGGRQTEVDRERPRGSTGGPLLVGGTEKPMMGERSKQDSHQPSKIPSLQFESARVHGTETAHRVRAVQVQSWKELGQPARYTLLPASSTSGWSDQRISPPRASPPSSGGLHDRASAAQSQFQGGNDRSVSPPLRDECTSRSGKIVVNLPPNLRKLSMQWSHLYYHVDEVYFNESNRLRYLDLSCNGLSVLEGPVVGLNHLTYLDLSINFAHHFGDHFFKCLSGLKVLNLSGNNFDYRIMKTDVFTYLTDLEILDISKNRLDGLYARALENLTKIKRIDISENKITEPFLDINVSKFKYLEALILRANNLNYLSEDLKSSLDDLARNRTVQVDLSLNPIICSCDRLDFLEWMNSSNVEFINKDLYYCLLSDGTAELMMSLEDRINRLRRQCRVGMLTFTLTLFGFIVLTLVCIVGVISYRFRWKLRYLYYAYRNQRRSLEDERLFRFDVFLSYAEEDIDFVHGELMNRLEKQERLRVCVHYRDFVPGRPIASNILEAIQNSRRTLFIVSADFLSSYWCLYELQMAKMESLHMDRDVVVMVLFENLRACKLPTEVLYYAQTDTYVEYPRDPRCLEYFWDNLVSALK